MSAQCDFHDWHEQFNSAIWRTDWEIVIIIVCILTPVLCQLVLFIFSRSEVAMTHQQEGGLRSWGRRRLSKFRSWALDIGFLRIIICPIYPFNENGDDSLARGRSKELGLEKARICGGFLLFTDWHCDQMPREHNNLNVIGLSISHIMENISGRKQSPTKNFVGYHWCTVSRSSATARHCKVTDWKSNPAELFSFRLRKHFGQGSSF